MNDEDATQELRRSILLTIAVVLTYVVVGRPGRGGLGAALDAHRRRWSQQHQLYYTDYASLRRVFSGTGLYALVAAVASALVALGVRTPDPPTRAADAGRGDRGLARSPPT